MNKIEQILKLAKVRTPKELYAKYATEEEFIAAHGAKLKKLRLSDTLQKAHEGAIMQSIQPIQPYLTPRIDTQTLGGAPEMTPMQPKPMIGNDWQGLDKVDTKTLAGDNSSTGFNLNQGMAIGKQLGEGIAALIEERKQMKKADQWNQVSKLQLQASRLKPDEYERDYARPEDYITSSGEMFPQYFTKNGGKIKKAANRMDFSSFMNNGGTDILSNYAGKTFDYNAGSQIGGSIGSAVKYIPGVGPVVSAIAEPVLTAIGGAVDPYARKIKKYTKQMNANINNMALMNATGGVQQQYSGFMEDGGRIQSMAPERFVNDLDLQLVPITPNNIYNPNFSFNRRGTTFRNEADEIDNQLTLLSQKKKLTNKDKAKMIELEDNKRMLFDYQENDKTKKFKAGGNLPMNGDLQLYDGNAEIMSNNPYSPEEGDTMMLKGPSHAEGGIDIAYGGNPVEAEGGEPVMKGQDGDLTIFGNMKIGKELIPLLGDEKAKNKKFKNYIADLSREEEKSNKLKDESVFSISDLKIETPLDKLKANSFKYNATGANSKLADIAEKKQKASALQTAMLDTANEIGIDPDALSRGQIKKTKTGANIPKAANGIQVPSREGVDENTYNMMVGFYNRAKKEGKGETVIAYKKLYNQFWPGKEEAIVRKEVPSNLAKQQGYTAADLANPDTPTETVLGTNNDIWGIRNNQLVPIAPLKNVDGWDNTLERLKQITYTPNEVVKTSKSPIQAQENNTNNLSKIDMLQSILPYFRPTDVETFDPRQLAGEMYALSTNQLEPVQAQQFTPELSSPYEISLQDQLNEITADKRSAERMAGYNPAAQAYIASQAYGAKSKVLADQLRINQEMKNKVFSENRNLLNTAKLQNLQILDNQYTRQAQAKSNTKDVNQAALSSIASKYQQNELERKTLQTYENMYNYRFGNNMRMQNWNGPALFNEPIVGSLVGTHKTTPADDRKVIYDENDNMYDLVPRRKSEKSNGGIVSAYRKL